ncbi:conserved hypothetical protein, partial [methanotrophic bacterial endosymbiont of Bathymodiolus sp.]
LKLVITDPVSQVLNESKIQPLKGQALKTNEDALDAIVCLYIAGLHAINHRGKTFGDLDLGYIWVPSGSLL